MTDVPKTDGAVLQQVKDVTGTVKLPSANVTVEIMKGKLDVMIQNLSEVGI